MANLEMNISAQVYQEKIDILTTQIENLSNIIERYRQKENELSNFIGEQDSNFENLRDNVRANTLAAKRAYTIAVNSRDALQKALTEMSGTTSQITTNINSSTDNVVNTMSAKLPVNQLLDG